ncbi:MAG: hypothetical protein GXY68_06820 [Chloroflexi bacterium]|jgi:hypothetical protein|nr:hypothetical protein [Chloroflexota bacterium]
MKPRTTVCVMVLTLALVLLPAAVWADDCVGIASGQISYPPGHYWAAQPVARGYDAYGFNYQAQRFRGWFVNSELGFMGLPPYEGDYAAYIAANPAAAALGDPADPTSFWSLKDLQLDIKWNEAYRARTDCDGNGWFDRHPGSSSYMGTGAWYTNHVSGVYLGQSYRSFSKVVAVPADAVLAGGLWYAADGRELGYAVPDVAPGMAGVFDLQAGVGLLYKGAPGLGR